MSPCRRIEPGRIGQTRYGEFDDRTLVCIQAGNVNSGAFDPAPEICKRAREAGAWVHVDGAFGLWAAVCSRYAELVDGYSLADSWAIDCHKWLNVPYDSGIAVVREAEHLRTAMSLSAAYLQTSGAREPCHYTPEASRRARGIELWAALRSLGREGLADLIERNCRQAKVFAGRLREAGFEVSDNVVLNQVVVSFGTDKEYPPGDRRVPECREPAGAGGRSGAAVPRCESACQVGLRLTKRRTQFRGSPPNRERGNAAQNLSASGLNGSSPQFAIGVPVATPKWGTFRVIQTRTSAS